MADGLCDVIEADQHGFCPEVVDFHLHFLGVDAPYFGFVDLLEVFNLVLKPFGVILQLIDGVIAGQVDLHHRNEFGEIEVEDVGVAWQVVRKAGVAHGDVHLVFDLAEGDFRRDREIELDVNGAVALLAGGDDHVDPRDAFELLFNGAGNQLLDVPGAVPRVRGADEDFGHHHLRKAFLGNGDVG